MERYRNRSGNNIFDELVVLLFDKKTRQFSLYPPLPSPLPDPLSLKLPLSVLTSAM